jgi:hypothetical protein
MIVGGAVSIGVVSLLGPSQNEGKLDNLIAFWCKGCYGLVPMRIVGCITAISIIL